jgi:hypothetical protein
MVHPGEGRSAVDILLRTLLLISVGTALLAAVTAAGAQASGRVRVLLLGDSILDCLRDESRVEHRMLEKLTARRPHVSFDVWNMARGGMWIGPADTAGIVGIAEPLFDGSDGKVYPPAAYGERLAALCDRLRQDYPGARLVLAAGMYQDQVRSLARQRGHDLADVCERVRAETAAGNWDLRVRQDGTPDASRDVAAAALLTLQDASAMAHAHHRVGGTR